MMRLSFIVNRVTFYPCSTQQQLDNNGMGSHTAVEILFIFQCSQFSRQHKTSLRVMLFGRENKSCSNQKTYREVFIYQVDMGQINSVSMFYTRNISIFDILITYHCTLLVSSPFKQSEFTFIILVSSPFKQS